MRTKDLSTKVKSYGQRRRQKKLDTKDLRKKYFVPMTFMLFFSFYALMSNIVIILWAMVKYIVRKSGMNKREKSVLDRVDVFNVLVSSIFPQYMPPYVKMAGTLSRYRLKRKLAKEIKNRGEKLGLDRLKGTGLWLAK
jgi:hypothetical protein